MGSMSGALTPAGAGAAPESCRPLFYSPEGSVILVLPEDPPPGRTQAPVGHFDVEGFFLFCFFWVVSKVEAGINTSPWEFTRDDRDPFNPNGSLNPNGKRRISIFQKVETSSSKTKGVFFFVF